MNKIALYILAALMPLSSIIIFLPSSVAALSGGSWQSGRIIDDAVFFNTNTYSANEVQAFLNAKVPACDTNGSQSIWDDQYSDNVNRATYASRRGVSTPFTCLKDYVTTFTTISGDEYCPGGLVGGTKSAAQIIAEASKNCGINPQVMLVTLQKEQSFITDDWPWPVQYEKATGYYCPDTAPCDPEYSGFVKQVYYGARQLQRYSKRADLFPNYRPGRTSRVYYNPNSGCGYGDVFIQTQGTSNLYIYTPYQPNASALNNLYGTGDGCSAYGNRNFWRMFNDWFGPTIGPLLRTSSSNTLYYSDGTKKYLVSSFGLAEQYGLTLNDVRFVAQGELDTLTTSSYPFSQVVKSDSDSDEDGSALYLISGGKRIQFADMGTFSSYGFQSNQISYLPIGSIFRLPADVNYASIFAQAPNQFVYKMETAKKRGIFDPGTYNSANPGGKVTRLSNFTLGLIQTGNPYIIGDAILRQSNGKSLLYQDGSWFDLPSMDVYNCWAFGSMKNFIFTPEQASPPSSIPKLTCSSELTDGTRFLMNSVNRLPVNPDWDLASFSKPLDRTIQRLPVHSLPAKSAFKSSAQPTIYLLDSDSKRPLANMQTYEELGLRDPNLITVHPGLLNNIRNGVTRFTSGSLMKDDSGKIYVTNGDTKLYVPSMSLFESFGFNTTQIKQPASNVQSFYATVSANLSSRFHIGSGSYLSDDKILLKIQDADKVHFGINGTTPTYSLYMLSNMKSERPIGRFVKSKSSTTIYHLENGNKRPVSSWSNFLSLGGNANSITELSNETLNIFPTGAPV